jgi:acetyl-CoA carboxylase biotin carboxylase subunit
MFKKILGANRGEIAIRIIRACKELGIRTVAVHSKVDANCLHVHYADESVCIGDASPSSSYLTIAQIISAAEICDVDAIHPGYGFLAENAHFADICENCNIRFIGPRPDQIRAMGDKIAARRTMKKAGIPTTPGSDGEVADENEAKKIATSIKYPLIIKAAAGGGGRGMRIAHNEASLIQGFHAARTEAEKAFGNPCVYIEKYIENPRHIEFQILADEYGHIIHLGERDCSLQRRHQKLIEESPSPIMTPDIRKKMGNMALKAAKAVNYTNAGTIEFIMDSKKNFYFMEMNTRIQVEHPVSEEVTGVDIVREQILIASGEKLSVRQKDAEIKGHAIECRINAENPYNNFSPCPGKISFFHPPGGKGIRLDSGVYSGYSIPPYYDSMIAKLIVYAEDRQKAIARTQRALDEFIIEGVATTIPFAKFILSSKDFSDGNYDTGSIGTIIKAGHFIHK